MVSGAAALSYCALLGGGCARDDAPARPNVVVIVADDLGWRDVGWHGSEIATPALDALADAGARLERFYVESTCSPTRAAFLTGRYPMRYGLQGVIVRPWTDVGLPLEERTLAAALSEAGYATHLVGKWHLGHAERAQLPTARGFDHHYGTYTGSIDYWTHSRGGALDWHRDGEPLAEEGYATDLLADEAVRIVSEHDFAQPLFLVVAFTAPHTPLQAPAELVARYASLPLEKRRTYAAMVSALDAGVGRIDGALGERGVRDETLLLFFSDNGGSREDGADNGPLYAGKGTPFEGALRVPAFAVWPQRIPAHTAIDAPLHAIDVYPTLARVGGATLVQPLPLDGLDVLDTLCGGPAPAREELLLRCAVREQALLAGNWKLVVRYVEDGRNVRLYDLATDEGERRDLAHERRGIANDLLARLARYQRAAEPREYVPPVKPKDEPQREVLGPDE